MTRADIYEYVTYYTERTAEDIKALKDNTSKARYEFYSDRIEGAMAIIEKQLGTLKRIDRREKETK
tara:strand:- start:441 stop:638 length:198 start_codon:yes stop_codon:yes gene_type:complete